MSVSTILHELSRNRKQAEHLLDQWCSDLLVELKASPKRRWAIVGGAVRDILLQPAEPVGQSLFWWTWPDTDLAIVGKPLPRLLASSRREVTYNTFGGWKVRDNHLGWMDVWCVGGSNDKFGSVESWKLYLNTVDFSLNAVAFLWPHRMIILHPKWGHDLKQKVIRKLHPANLSRELCAVRAIALAAKLELLTGSRFSLGRDAANDYRWLTHRADHSATETALDYLSSKIKSNRWPIAVIDRFRDELARKPGSPIFKDEFDDRFSAKCSSKPARRKPKKAKSIELTTLI